MSKEYPHQIALLGLGTIGLSMLAMHLRRPDTSIAVYDPRPDTETQIRNNLPSILEFPGSATASGSETNIVDHLFKTSRLKLASTLQEAVTKATIIQEQSPEVTVSKQALWKEVMRFAKHDAHLWSSSSGIAASAQGATCDPADGVGGRLLVAHPFNPPHIMPLVEVVPGPETAVERVEFVKGYFEGIPGPGSVDGQTAGHYRPVTLHKEAPGVGPRWAGSGVFESYHAGGGEGGIGAFLQKLEPTIQDVWGDLGQIDIQGDQAWRDMVVRQTEEAYGPSTAESRKKKEEMLREVIEMQKKTWEP
ncbi:hypothetical protein N7444_013975 [Penicillium canescens]|nr:hypothetical protein N7444_013975 [Penicillium canescens]